MGNLSFHKVSAVTRLPLKYSGYTRGGDGKFGDYCSSKHLLEFYHEFDPAPHQFIPTLKGRGYFFLIGRENCMGGQGS